MNDTSKEVITILVGIGLFFAILVGTIGIVEHYSMLNKITCYQATQLRTAAEVLLLCK